MAQKLKFGKGTWATKEGSTLAYNDEGGNFKPLPFTTTRDSIGTRVNKEGLIEVVGKDKPRIDYTDSTDGVLLLENSSTNLITYSEDFSDASWTKTNSTIQLNSSISPDGTLNADLLTQTSNGGIIRFNATYSGSETASVFVKKGSANFLGLFSAGNEVYFDLNNVISSSYSGASIIDYGIESYGNGWYRCHLTTSFSGVSSIRIYPSETDGGLSSSTESIYIFGAMLEQSSYPTSYIPTSGSTVQRAAETANGAGNSEVFNDSSGVLFVDTSGLVDTATSERIVISDGTSASNRIVIEYDETFGLVKFWVTGGGTTNGEVQISGVNKTQSNKISMLYQSNVLKIYINGFNVGNGTGIVTPTGLDTLKFEQAIGGNNFYGKTKEIGYYDTTLTDAELETLTSYRSLNELVTELNLNTL